MTILFFAEKQTSRSKQMVIACAAVLIMAVAGYLTFSSARGGNANRAVVTDSTYICLNDAHTFSLTPAQVTVEEKAARAAQGEEGMRGPPPKLKCPQCGQFAAVKAVKCPKDGTLIPVQDKTGQPGKCPKCGTSSVDASVATP